LSNGKSLTPSLYKSFLRNNFGSAAGIIEKYYPLSMFEALASGNTQYGVLYAISQVITDSDYKCVAYEGLVSAALKNIPAWTYEYTHNNTCPWLGTLKQLQGNPEEMALVGATHTAEIPFVFGNMNNQPLPGGTCNATEAEDNLSKQMMSLWTAMAENADPSTDAIQWPQFTLEKNASSPGLIFADSTLSGQVDYSACKLWSKVYNLIEADNSTAMATATATPISGSGKPTASPPATPPTSGAATTVPATGGLLALGALLTVVFA
jgi:para-nitrobenzyl esterase